MAEKRKLQVPKGKSIGARTVKMEVRFIAPGYFPLFEDAVQVIETERLIPFELICETGTGPDFIGRWDDNATPESTLDIDVEGVGKEEQERFKHCKDGSRGHWTKPI